MKPISFVPWARVAPVIKTREAAPDEYLKKFGKNEHNPSTAVLIYEYLVIINNFTSNLVSLDPPTPRAALILFQYRA